MQFFRFILASLPFAVVASALVVRDSANTNMCEGATVIQTSSFVVKGNTITRSTLSCPDANILSSLGATVASRSLVADIQSRSASECTVPAECACGDAQSLVCTILTATSPNPSDCSILIDAISVIAQENGATYFLGSGLTDQISFGSCTSAVTNESGGELEFCWNERATDISLINQECFEMSAGTTGAFESANWISFVIKAGP